MLHKIALALGWLWVAVGAVMVGVAVFATASPPEVAPAAAQPVATSGTRDVGTAIQPFVDFAARSAEQGGGGLPPMTLAHPYAAEGLRRLADALTALSGASSDAAAKARKAADAITRDPRSLRHADDVHGAFSAAAAELDGMAPADAGRLDRLADAVTPSRPLLKQKQQVRDFFIAAGRAVSDAARARTTAAAGDSGR